MALGGALGGLAVHFLSSSPGSSPWALAIVGGAALAGACVATGGLRGLLAGLRGQRLAITALVGVGVFFLAAWVLRQVATAQELSVLPPWSVAALAGAGFSTVSVFALLPRHVYVAHDRVGVAYEPIRARATGEVGDLSRRGVELWRKAERELAETDPTRPVLEDAVLRLLDCARRWQAVEAGTPSKADALVERMTALDERIAATEDAVARDQYVQAKGALAEQLNYLQDIGRSRDRVLARMHNYLAAMEQLHMAVINLESTHASAAIQPLLADLEQLGDEVDAAAVS